jgi:galactokinase
VTSDPITKLEQAFERRFGRRPAGVWSAPGRVNLIGEHTDYNGGFVFPMAIQYRAWVAASARSDGKLCVFSEQLGDAELSIRALSPRRERGWWSYAAGAVWALAEHSGRQPSGFDLVIDSDVPVGAGLSSSAAIECSVALAAAHLSGVELDCATLARVAHRAEFEFVGVPCGTMDQTISACGRQGAALLIDCQSGAQTQVTVNFASAGLSLVVIDTCAPHSLVDGEYAERRSSCEAAARALGVQSLRAVDAQQLARSATSLTEKQLRRARHVVTENQRVEAAVNALASSDFEKLGALLTASHASLRDDFEVTIAELDVAVESALGAGALGARMTGAGFGGCVLALCPAERRSTLEAAVAAAFAERGFTAPRFFIAEASQGANRAA